MTIKLKNSILFLLVLVLTGCSTAIPSQNPSHSASATPSQAKGGGTISIDSFTFPTATPKVVAVVPPVYTFPPPVDQPPPVGPGLGESICIAGGGSPIDLTKPIVYLYPTQTTSVDVSLDKNAIVTASDPHYPVQGWQNIVAHPDGTLDYAGKIYNELFYETRQYTIAKPTSGIILSTNQLSEQLASLTKLYGLNDNESQEFLDYWVPKLQNLRKPYFLFSVIDDAEKERIDHLTITPKPNTFISLIVLFQPLDKPVPIPAPPYTSPAQRNGFTVVEWGGMIL